MFWYAVPAGLDAVEIVTPPLTAIVEPAGRVIPLPVIIGLVRTLPLSTEMAHDVEVKNKATRLRIFIEQ